ncbi:MAG: TolC family protein [Bacteroidetes bacterium]|nr:TolC family protein [Bacteroidota bacterium]
MNRIKLPIFLSILILFTSSGFGQEQPSKLDALVAEAIKVSPRIKVLKSKHDAAVSRIEIGTNLPDPMLTLGLMNLPTNSFSFTQEPMTGKIVGLSQGFPFPGSLSAKADVIAVDTSIINEENADLKNEIRRDMSKLYYDLILTRREIELVLESKSLLHQISDVAKSSYEVSNASLHNVIQVEVQLTRVRDKIEMLRGNEKGLIAEINALLLRDEDSEVSTEETDTIAAKGYSTNSLISIAKIKRPFLNGIKYSEEKSRLMEELAEYDFYPNFNLGLQYTERDNISASGVNLNDFLSVMVGISLPINYGGKKTARVEEAQFLQTLNRERFNSSVQSLSQAFGKLTAKLHELENREKLVTESLLPQAEQLLKAALADYQVAKIDFVNVMKAENDILTIKTELVTLRTNYYKNLAEIEFLTGEKIINSK